MKNDNYFRVYGFWHIFVIYKIFRLFPQRSRANGRVFFHSFYRRAHMPLTKLHAVKYALSYELLQNAERKETAAKAHFLLYDLAGIWQKQ